MFPYTNAYRNEATPLPPVGEPIEAFKKAWTLDAYGYRTSVIVVLSIPAEAERVNATDYGTPQRKCRASAAFVIGFLDVETGEMLDVDTKVYSGDDNTFFYKIGRVVRPKGPKYDPSTDNPCLPGIHFFTDINEAASY